MARGSGFYLLADAVMMMRAKSGAELSSGLLSFAVNKKTPANAGAFSLRLDKPDQIKPQYFATTGFLPTALKR